VNRALKIVQFVGVFNEAKTNALCEDHASLSIGDAVTVRQFLYNSVWGYLQNAVDEASVSLKSAQ
jgi:hypothetical protein